VTEPSPVVVIGSVLVREAQPVVAERKVESVVIAPITASILTCFTPSELVTVSFAELISTNLSDLVGTVARAGFTGGDATSNHQQTH